VLALVALVTDGPATGTRRGRAELCVVIDERTMRNGLHDRSIVEHSHGADLPIEAIRRMACTAEIVAIVLNADSVALDVRRSSRMATVAQRRAAGDVSDLRDPRVQVPFRLTEPHHIHGRPSGGRVDNLIPLCKSPSPRGDAVCVVAVVGVSAACGVGLIRREGESGGGRRGSARSPLTRVSP
jgi:hypothetical protein